MNELQDVVKFIGLLCLFFLAGVLVGAEWAMLSLKRQFWSLVKDKKARAKILDAIDNAR